MNKPDNANLHIAAKTSSIFFAVYTLACAALLVDTGTARANVYATNLRINNSFTNVAFSGTNVAISYILNEPATLGVSVNIMLGTNITRSIVVSNGAPGTLRGTNVIYWDGKDGSSNFVGSGSYSVSVTARTTGFEDWAQVSDDNASGTYVWDPRGIAVNRNTNSPFYGRVFVSNASPGPNAGSDVRDDVGLHKVNADGSPAQDGFFSTGGWSWAGDGNSPWKIEVGPDDRVYVTDFVQQGIVISLDELLSTNSLKVVLRDDNWPEISANLSGPFITSNGTNLQIWMADAVNNGAGIRRWDIGTNGIIATNDTGTTIVQAGAGSDLSAFPFDVALDASNNIYTVQRTIVANDPANRVFRFPPYIGTNAPETNADWKIGAGDDTMSGADGIAVSPSGAYVAVSFRGLQTGLSPYQNSSVRVFATTNGASIATPTPAQTPGHEYRDTAWDAVGNLYVADYYDGIWRAYSPPGTNQSTTVALATVTMPSPATPPVLSQPTYSNGQLTFLLTGDANIIYYIEVSTNFQTWTRVATNNSVFTSRTVTVPAPTSLSFYRVVVGPVAPASPFLGAASMSTNQFRFSLLGGSNFTYVILGSVDFQTWTPITTNSSGGATRQISVPASAPMNFYRAQALP